MVWCVVVVVVAIGPADCSTTVKYYRYAASTVVLPIILCTSGRRAPPSVVTHCKQASKQAQTLHVSEGAPRAVAFDIKLDGTAGWWSV